MKEFLLDLLRKRIAFLDNSIYENKQLIKHCHAQENSLSSTPEIIRSSKAKKKYHADMISRLQTKRREAVEYFEQLKNTIL